MVGLMTMAAITDDAESVRPCFKKLRLLRDNLRKHMSDKDKDGFKHLSMGMTQDFEVAIEEGADFLRIGSALFEGLN